MARNSQSLYWNGKMGAPIASASVLNMGNDGDTFHITGTTRIDFVRVNDGFVDGNKFEWIFDSTVVIGNRTISPPAGSYQILFATPVANTVTNTVVDVTLDKSQQAFIITSIRNS